MSAPAEPPMPNPMRRTMRITWACFYISIALLLIGLGRSAWLSQQPHPPVDNADTFSIVTETWGAIGVPTTLWLVWMYGKSARRAAAMVSGENCIARWTCTEAEWAHYVQAIAQGSKDRSRMLFYVFGGTGLLCICFVIIPTMLAEKPAPLSETLGSVGLVIGMLAIMFLFFWLLMVYLPVRTISHPKRRDVFVGMGGVVIAGKFASWEIMGSALRTIRYDPGDPGTIAFGWNQPMPAPAGGSLMQSAVPVPKANDADARHVVATFRERYSHLR